MLPNQDGEVEFSANRTIDYARERLDACIFYDPAAEGMSFPKGTYVVDILARRGRPWHLRPRAPLVADKPVVHVRKSLHEAP